MRAIETLGTFPTSLTLSLVSQRISRVDRLVITLTDPDRTFGDSRLNYYNIVIKVYTGREFL